MQEEDRDIVEFTDDDGNSLLLEVLDSFYYNGEEFVVLGDVDDACECEQEDGACGCGHEHDEDCEHEHSLYIMKVETSTDENGDEVEEFTPVEENLMEALIKIVETRFTEDDDEDEDEAEDS